LEFAANSSHRCRLGMEMLQFETANRVERRGFRVFCVPMVCIGTPRRKSRHQAGFRDLCACPPKEGPDGFCREALDAALGASSLERLVQISAQFKEPWKALQQSQAASTRSR